MLVAAPSCFGLIIPFLPALSKHPQLCPSFLPAPRHAQSQVPQGARALPRVPAPQAGTGSGWQGKAWKLCSSQPTASAKTIAIFELAACQQCKYFLNELEGGGLVNTFLRENVTELGTGTSEHPLICAGREAQAGAAGWQRAPWPSKQRISATCSQFQHWHTWQALFSAAFPHPVPADAVVGFGTRRGGWEHPKSVRGQWSFSVPQYAMRKNKNKNKEANKTTT